MGKPKQLFSVALIVLFLAAIGAPFVAYVFDLDNRAALTENRSLAARPELPKTEDELSTYPKRFDAWWRDAFAFRPQLIRWNSLAEFALGTSGSPQVIVGRQGWLFFTGEDSVEKFRGQRPMDEAQLREWERQLESRAAACAAVGAKYVFIVAPDKESIHDEFMPARIRRGKERRLDQLLSRLRNNPKLQVIDLRPALMAGKAAFPLYSRTDTHWNDDGALIAYRYLTTVLLAQGGHDAPVVTFERRRAADWSGDLAAMLGLQLKLTEPRFEQVPTSPSQVRELGEAGHRPAGSSRYTEYEGPPEARDTAVVFHDSFFLAPEERGDPRKPARTDRYMPKRSAFRMTSLLATHFRRSVFTWQHHFDAGLVERERPALVIQEVVERSL